jgi:hypothetical protein
MDMLRAAATWQEAVGLFRELGDGVDKRCGDFLLMCVYVCMCVLHRVTLHHALPAACKSGFLAPSWAASLARRLGKTVHAYVCVKWCAHSRVCVCKREA